MKSVIGLTVFIFVFIIACAGTSEQLSEEDLNFNPNEPWTGTWKVTGDGFGLIGDYVLKLKQDGNLVKSLRGSSYDFEGKVVGNQLKGRFDDDHELIHRLTLKMSEDLKSFEGKDLGGEDTFPHLVEGVRQY